MNVLSPVPDCSAPLDHYATALAHTQQMHSELAATREENDQLRAGLHRERDRVVMLVDDRDRQRQENIMLRRLLTELATQMTNISLLTVTAQNIVKLVHEIDTAPLPESDALATLEAEFTKGFTKGNEA